MSSEQEKTNEQILKDLIQAFSSLKQKMEDPNYIALSNDLRNLTQNQSDMKRDLKDLKKACLLYTSPSPRDRGCARMPASP